MIKVPATAAGVPAVERLTAAGVNVNVTLLFSVERYAQMIEAYLSGLERRAAEHAPLRGIASVASFFVSRVDAKADAVLPPGSPLHGRVAIANALRGYELHLERFVGARWEHLRSLGARVQRPLWASTATKSDDLPDLLYVEGLVTPGAINTMPEATLLAFADHGSVRTPEAAQGELDLSTIAAELEREGVEAFCASYAKLLDRIASRL
jgi:transaldolase